ncbi:hypothetical protein B0H10DRAFT_2064886, partial [Mycena sp. CBHHK59/15]
ESTDSRPVLDHEQPAARARNGNRSMTRVGRTRNRKAHGRDLALSFLGVRDNGASRCMMHERRTRRTCQARVFRIDRGRAGLYS